MIYKQFKDKKLSLLGFGAMRLPTFEKNDQIDVEKASLMVQKAIDLGINYFDTAWGYHGGQSEIVIGEILSKFDRERFYLASKFPGYDLSTFEKKEEVFSKQLEKCKVEYFDFYLCHNVNERNVDNFLDEKYSVVEYLVKQKEEGKIKHLGFSAHGDIPVLEKFLQKYGKHMEFCQLQINYLDWTWQKGKEKIELCKKYNLPVWIMEPLRGGKLVNLNQQIQEKVKEISGFGHIESAFRWLSSIDCVGMILSGMSTLEQLEENVKYFDQEKPLSAQQFDQLVALGKSMIEKVSCTSCKYCVDYCPQKLEIPRLLRLYNEYCFAPGDFFTKMAIDNLPQNKKPSCCIGCKSCEEVCPQQIEISKELASFAKQTKNP
ncbi:MAG: aldo/keto reductase [Clostridia bacterium]|nr:aldo/keto reductase [Clostridia bacterium]